MADQLRDIVTRMVDAGESEADIALVIQRLSHDAPKTPERTWTDTAVDALPMAGGALGGILGGAGGTVAGMGVGGVPGAVGGAAVGGAGGEAAKQLINRLRGVSAPGTMGEAAGDIARQGGMQGAAELAGAAVAAAVRPVAKTIYGLALRPSKAIMRDAGGGKLLTGLKRVVDQGFDDRVMPSGMGVTKAKNLVSASANDATAIAERSPAMVETKRVVQRALDEQGKLGASDLVNAGVPVKGDQIASQIGNVIDANPGQVSMSQLLKMRRGAEDVAAPVFKAAKLPGGPGRVAPGSEASVARSLSGAYKQTLDDQLGEAFKAANQRTMRRAAVSHAVEDASSRPNMLTNIISAGAGVGSAATSGDVGEAAKKAALLRLILSPTAQGGAALAMGTKALYPQLIRFIMAAQDKPK